MQSSVVQVGCGALGSTLAQLLVRAGVGTYAIVDPDREIPGVVMPIAGDHLLARAVQSRSLVIAGSEDTVGGPLTKRSGCAA